MIQAIYEKRYFVIHDHTGSSTERTQHAGIAQGCPLSPYLFIAVQTVLLYDVFDQTDLREEPEFVVTRDVLYADDTLLASQHPENLQRLLNAIVEEGKKYGLELNWDKTVQIQVSTGISISRPDGGAIKTVREAVYLGGLITCDGRVASELSRRIGEATGVFIKLRKMWSHSSVGVARKFKIYESCVLSKLMYSLDSVWLLRAERARLDAFHCRCLRRLLGIPCSLISRITKQ